MNTRRRFAQTTLLAAAIVAAASANAQTPSAGRAEPGIRPREVLDPPAMAFEQPVIDMIAAPAPPASFKVAVKTERFRGPGGWYLPVAIALDGAELAPASTTGAAAGPVDVRLDTVVLVRDPSGATVAKVSRSVLFRPPREQLSTFRADRVPLTCFSSRQVLAPGPYTLQVGVYDPTTKRGAVVTRKITLPALPAAADAPALSSLVLGSRVESLDPNAWREINPFEVDGANVVPDASGRFSKSRGQMIAYFKLYAAPGTSYQTRIVFMRGDAAFSSTPMQALQPTSANGEVGTASVVSLSAFEPGVYRAVLQVFTPGSTSLVASAVTPFLIEP